MLTANLQSDTKLSCLIDEEYDRQFKGIELIASENFAPKGILQALGSVLTNKYSEGQVGRRYYGGNSVIDKIESLAKQRALQAYRRHSIISPPSGVGL
jgi:glycine hydroxymethyltransferase